MKTRSEWGSWEDWMEFMPFMVHEERKHPHGGYAVSFGGIVNIEISGTIENARRAAVESYCKRFSKELPWQPDYDLSTIEGCKEAIKSCGYKVNSNILVGKVAVIQIEDAQRIKNIIFELTLEQWQEAAQFAIDNHEH